MVVLVVADLFEVHRAPLQVAQFVVEVAVDRTRVHHWHAGRVQRGLVVRLGCVEEIHAQLHGDARIVDHPLEPGRVPILRQALPGVLEIPVVVVESYRQTIDDRRGQLAGVGLPLLGRVVFDERLIQRASNQRDALVVQVLRILACQFARLLLDQRLGFSRRVVCTEELVDRAQIRRQRIYLAVMCGVHAMHVVREFGETVDILPHALIRRMEQMRTVLVDFGTGLFVEVRVRVAADVVAHVDDMHARASLLHCLLRHRQTEQACADHYQIRIRHILSHHYSLSSGCYRSAAERHGPRVRFPPCYSPPWPNRGWHGWLRMERTSGNGHGIARSACGRHAERKVFVPAWCTLVQASMWRYVTQLPQGRNAARVSGL